MEQELREATEEDIRLLYDWANDVEVRKNSFVPHEITWEEHQRWYDGILHGNGQIHQYIFLCDGRAVGQVRIRVEGEEAEVGYSIAREYRGRGYAKQMLTCLIQKVREKFPEIKRMMARVKPDNDRSRSVFLKLGYRENCVCFELKLADDSEARESL